MCGCPLRKRKGPLGQPREVVVDDKDKDKDSSDENTGWWDRRAGTEKSDQVT